MGGLFKKPDKPKTAKYIERPGAALMKDMPAYTQAAKLATKERLAGIEQALPGAAAQRKKGVNQLNQAMDVIGTYLRGDIPQEVKEQTMRTIAEFAGAGFNPATAGRTGGFQAVQGLVPRQLGLTSLDIQGRGLAAAPAIQASAQNWQQLAESFTYDPFEAAQASGPSAQYGQAKAAAAARDQAAYQQALANQQKNIMGAVTGIAALAAPIAAPALLGGLAGGAAALGLGTTANASTLLAGGAGTGLAGSFQNLALGSFGTGGGAPSLAALSSIYGR